MPSGSISGSPSPRPIGPPPIGRLAWRVFAPLDAAVNVAINAAIAWWLFGGREDIPLTGPDGLTMMALPMTFILATATTCFGIWNAVRERRAGRAAPPLAADAAWLARACVEAFAVGAAALALASAVAWLLGRVAPELRVGPVGAVLGIAGYAGLLAFILHGRAVARGGGA
ncbi:MAG: hypothetical protein ACKO1M_07195 [Planctomycetota bacterium]